MIVIGRKFYNIRADDIKTIHRFQQIHKRHEIDASGFRRPGTRHYAGVEHIEIDRDVKFPARQFFPGKGSEIIDIQRSDHAETVGMLTEQPPFVAGTRTNSDNCGVVDSDYP